MRLRASDGEDREALGVDGGAAGGEAADLEGIPYGR